MMATALVETGSRMDEVIFRIQRDRQYGTASGFRQPLPDLSGGLISTVPERVKKNCCLNRKNLNVSGSYGSC